MTKIYTQKQPVRKLIISAGVYLTILVIATIGLGILFTKNSKATAITGFEPGRIIDDVIFTNNTSMTTSQIQTFLNSKVPTCDTWGNQTSEFGGGTRRQWAEARGYTAPFTCLKDYQENGKSSAQIIKEASDRYQINPQVIIVLLQKEQALVTDTWPISTQYKTATGYGCPNTAPCNTQYYGLTNQINWASTMYRAILNGSSNWYTPYILGENYIRWNPNASCGGSNVNIQNRSTQALYNYTPYQPNQSALNAGYGLGDSCGSYGNRNFYIYFRDWFGATKQTSLPGCQEATNTSRVCVWEMNTPGGQQYLTSINQERDDLATNNSGYQYQGRAFFANISALPGNIPVYRLIKSDGSTFLTADKNEYDVLAASGLVSKGVSFYADPGDSNSGYPVYRLYSSAGAQHRWTIDENEKNSLINSGYISEGIAFTSISPIRQEAAPPTGKSLIYRFSSMPGNSHFWTKDVFERDSMIKAGYRYEGVAWISSTLTTSIPVYRLYSVTMQKHLYTTDKNEKNVLDATSSWSYEGIAYYANPDTSSKPVYRLYSSITTNHLLTDSSHEKEVLVSNGTFRDEGIAFYTY